MGRTVTGSWMFSRIFDAGAAFVLRRTASAVTRQLRAFMPALPLAADGAAGPGPRPPSRCGSWQPRRRCASDGRSPRPRVGGPTLVPRPGSGGGPAAAGHCGPGSLSDHTGPARPGEARPARSGLGPGPRWPGRGGSARLGVHVARGPVLAGATAGPGSRRQRLGVTVTHGVDGNFKPHASGPGPAPQNRGRLLRLECADLALRLRASPLPLAQWQGTAAPGGRGPAGGARETQSQYG
jgi:hypothetical protein